MLKLISIKILTEWSLKKDFYTKLIELIMAEKLNISIIGVKGYPYVYGGYETFIKEISERLCDKYNITVYCHKSLF